MPAISVVIATYQREWSLRLCLEALKQQTFQDFNVFVVDDGGEDGSRRVTMEAGLAGAYLWHPHNGFGLARSRNDGAGASSSPLLHFIDSDIMLSPTSLEVAWEMYDKNQHRAIGGYYKYLPGMSITPEDVRLRWQDIWDMKLPLVPITQIATPIGMDVREAKTKHDGHPDFFVDEDRLFWSPLSLLGGNMVIPAEQFEKAGGFDETFTTYGGEDAAMSLSLLEAGCPISYSRRIAGAHIAHTKDAGASGPGERDKVLYLAKKHPFYFTEDGQRRPENWATPR